MFVFLTVVGGLLLGFGAIFTIMSIVPTSMDASWDELKNAFRVMVGRPQFRVGVGCLVLGLIMLLGSSRMVMWW